MDSAQGLITTNFGCKKPRLQSDLTAASPSMEALAKDLNTALEESTAQQAQDLVAKTPDQPRDSEEEDEDTVSPGKGHPAGAATPSRRRAWRRRCKSTSNLTALATTAAGNASCLPPSDDTSTSSENEQEESALHSHPTGFMSRGTSSLHMSDSDEMGPPKASTSGASVLKRPKDYLSRKKRGGGSDQGTLGKKTSRHHHHLPIESDSVNEAFSPLRPSTKRKRRFKRMALDPDPTPVSNANSQGASAPAAAAAATGVAASKAVSKRQKIRDKYQNVNITKHRQPQPQQVLSFAAIAGKRKRSNREKSLEPEHMSAVESRSAQARAIESMDCDMDDKEEGDSSSISSSEWDDDDDSDNLEFASNNGREADDEQSDWPGPEFDSNRGFGGGGSSVLTDDDDDLERMSSLGSLFGRSGDAQMTPLTATARQAYLARMKRLAECVPGREIRAGTRKLRNRQIGFTIKSPSSEQLSRFLQDPTRTELKLTVLRTTDRNQVMHLANLYNLSVRLEGSNLILLSKTGKTVKLKEFAVPGTPKTPIDFKRRRRTPPNSPLLEGSSASNEPPDAVMMGSVVAAVCEIVPEEVVVAGGSASSSLLVPVAAQQPPGPSANSSDVSMQPSPETEGRPIVVPLLNRSESPILGASELKDRKAKFSGSLSS